MPSSAPTTDVFVVIDDIDEPDGRIPQRTQSISSSSSYKMDRPSYTYSTQSPHGMSPYGIADNAAVVAVDYEGHCVAR